MAKYISASHSLDRILFLPALLFLLMLLGFSPTLAQEEVLDAKTYVSQDGVQPGGTIDVAFVLAIIPGWHINGPELADPYMISCSLKIEEDEAVEVQEIYYPVPETRSYSFSEAELQVYESEAILGARIRVSENRSPGSLVLKANFLFQACDNVSCMAPETIEFEVPLEVVQASKKIQYINKDIFAQIEFR
jgi:thiol:disulfide interchange protein DsbD